MAKKNILLISEDAKAIDQIKPVAEKMGYGLDVKSFEPNDNFGSPDLIIIDAVKGKRALGILAARALRRSAKYAKLAKTPLLMISDMHITAGLEFPRATKLTYRIPVDEFVRKPLAKTEELEEKISKLI